VRVSISNARFIEAEGRCSVRFGGESGAFPSECVSESLIAEGISQDSRLFSVENVSPSAENVLPSVVEIPISVESTPLPAGNAVRSSESFLSSREKNTPSLENDPALAVRLPPSTGRHQLSPKSIPHSRSAGHQRVTRSTSSFVAASHRQSVFATGLKAVSVLPSRENASHVIRTGWSGAPFL
jgi:hypothetical protein